MIQFLSGEFYVPLIDNGQDKPKILRARFTHHRWGSSIQNGDRWVTSIIVNSTDNGRGSHVCRRRHQSTVRRRAFVSSRVELLIDSNWVQYRHCGSTLIPEWSRRMCVGGTQCAGHIVFVVCNIDGFRWRKLCWRLESQCAIDSLAKSNAIFATQRVHAMERGNAFAEAAYQWRRFSKNFFRNFSSFLTASTHFFRGITQQNDNFGEWKQRQRWETRPVRAVVMTRLFSLPRIDCFHLHWMESDAASAFHCFDSRRRYSNFRFCFFLLIFFSLSRMLAHSLPFSDLNQLMMPSSHHHRWLSDLSSHSSQFQMAAILQLKSLSASLQSSFISPAFSLGTRTSNWGQIYF